MKFVTLTVLAMCLAIVAATELPSGFNSASDVAAVLANEPEAAKESRFAQVASSGSDTITFRDSGSSVTSSSDDDTDSEYDAQIEQVENDMKKLKENIKESEEACNRLREQQSELRSLEEQKSHLEKEKEKRVLQAKLERQMKDLEEINKMSRALRNKFAELKRTQKVIKAKMTGTRSSLNSLDNEPALDGDVVKAQPDNLASEMNSMQEAQKKILNNAHTRQSSSLKAGLKQVNNFHGY